MKDNCSMAWVVLSSSSLLDNQSGSAPYPQAKLESFVRDCGYKPVTLHNIMRNSSNISTATSLDNVEKYRARAYSPKSISSGFSSTVMGTRPTCYVYQYRMHFDATYDVNYEVVATCIKHYLENCKTACAKTVILCDRRISPWHVKQLLAVDVTLYDAGHTELFSRICQVDWKGRVLSLLSVLESWNFAWNHPHIYWSRLGLNKSCVRK